LSYVTFKGQTDLYFVADEAIKENNYTQVLLGNKDLLSFTLPHDDIKEIHHRWYQLRDDALEIFMTNGKTCLLSFKNTKVCVLVHLE
jgi:phosphate uptake regulator